MMKQCIICGRDDRDLSLVGMCGSCEHDWAESEMSLGDYVQYAIRKTFVEACNDAR